MSNSTEIVPFQFGDSSVRVVTIDDEPWFVLVDLCRALGLEQVSRVRARLDDDLTSSTPILDALGRTQYSAIVSEAGMYEVVIRSDKPEAKRFRDWVTKEVLPSIRKTGSYSIKPVEPTMPVINMRDPRQLQVAMLQLIEVNQEQQALIDQQQTKIKADAPKVVYADALLSSPVSQLIRDVAKTLGLGVMATYAALRTKGVLLRNNVPAAVYISKGYFEVEARTYETEAGTRTRLTPMVTPRGMEYIRRFAERHADLFNKAAA